MTVWSLAIREDALIAYLEERGYLLYTVGEFITWGLGSSFQGIPGLGLHTVKQKDELIETENVNR